MNPSKVLSSSLFLVLLIAQGMDLAPVTTDSSLQASDSPPLVLQTDSPLGLVDSSSSDAPTTQTQNLVFQLEIETTTQNSAVPESASSASTDQPLEAVNLSVDPSGSLPADQGSTAVPDSGVTGTENPTTTQNPNAVAESQTEPVFVLSVESSSVSRVPKDLVPTTPSPVVESQTSTNQDSSNQVFVTETESSSSNPSDSVQSQESSSSQPTLNQVSGNPVFVLEVENQNPTTTTAPESIASGSSSVNPSDVVFSVVNEEVTTLSSSDSAPSTQNPSIQNASSENPLPVELPSPAPASRHDEE